MDREALEREMKEHRRLADAIEMKLDQPAIAAGWTSCDTPPDGLKNVELIIHYIGTDHGAAYRRIGWFRDPYWAYPEDSDGRFPIIGGTPICWREITSAKQPQPLPSLSSM
jgi:hypothetical protein